jgi:ABC-type transporter Mla subunit MlaD
MSGRENEPPVDPSDRMGFIVDALANLQDALANLQVGQDNLQDAVANLRVGQGNLTRTVNENHANLQVGQANLQNGQANLQNGQANLQNGLQVGQANLQVGQANLQNGLATLTRNVDENHKFVKQTAFPLGTNGLNLAPGCPEHSPQAAYTWGGLSYTREADDSRIGS